MPQPNLSLTLTRKRAAMSKAALGRKAGVTPGYISHIETGLRRGSDEVLRRIADALGIDVREIGGRRPEDVAA